ncbi:MAG: hypothetical protein ABIJ09_21190 [Pseudomonadota bacterium]
MLLLCGWGTPAALRADNAQLPRALGLYEEMRYEESAQALREALAQRGNSPDEVATIYQHLGLVAGYMDRHDEAVDAFSRWLCIAPDAKLAQGLSPKVQKPLDEARQRMAAQQTFKLVHTPVGTMPAAGGLELDAELQPDALGLATGVTLQYRAVGAPSFAALHRDGSGRLIFTVSSSELPACQDAEYFLQINEAHGGAIGQFGSERTPIRVRAAQAAVVATAAAGAAVDEVSAPFYAQTWFLVAAGVGAALLVAGGTTVAVVALAPPAAESASFGEVKQEVAR